MLTDLNLYLFVNMAIQASRRSNLILSGSIQGSEFHDTHLSLTGDGYVVTQQFKCIHFKLFILLENFEIKDSGKISHLAYL